MMGALKDKFDTVYRDFSTDGVSSSGLHEPSKAEIRTIGPVLDQALATIGTGALISVTYGTLAELNADLQHEADSIALVYADALSANRDLWIKSGAAGAGAWTNTGAMHSIADTLVAPYLADAEALRSQVIEQQLVGPQVSFVGDSRTFQGLKPTNPPHTYYSDRSPVHWLRGYSRQRFDTKVNLNFGQSGWRTDQILAALPGYIDTMVAERVEVCILLAGTNDLAAVNPATGVNYTAADTLANLTAMVDLLLAAGIKVVIQNETPRTGLSAGLNAQHVAVRDGIEAMNDPIGGIAVAYTWQALADAGDPTIAAAWATVDGTHMTVRGTQVQGLAIEPALAIFLPRPREILPRDNVQLIGPFGNFLINSQMTGAGPVADNWTYTNNAGGSATAVNSIVTDEGVQWQEADLSGVPSGNDMSPLFLRWEQNIDSLAAQFGIGDTIEACVEVKVTDPVGLRAVDLYLVGPNVFDGAADIPANIADVATAAYQLGPDDYRIVLRTVPLTITAAFAILRMRLRAVGASGVEMGGKIRWRLAAIRKLNR